MKNKKSVIITAIIITLAIISFFVYRSLQFKMLFNALSKTLESRVEICLEQYKKVTSYNFTKDEKKAIEVIRSFDPKKLVVDEDPQFSSLLAENCTPRNIKNYMPLMRERKSCRKVFYEHDFFKNALKAAKEHKWKKSTRLLIKEKIIEYSNHQALSSAPFLNLLVSVSLFKLLFDDNLIKKKYQQMVEEMFANAERDSLRLRGSFRKAMAGSDTPSCSGYIQYNQSQRKMATELSSRIRDLIKEIKK